jgi:pimeloyl-ACP methyl ester carboxylesterase
LKVKNRNFVSEKGLQEGFDLLGFSMGGKVAMTFSLDEVCQDSVRKLIIGDVSPVKYDFKESTIPKTIFALTKLVFLFF